MIKEITTVIEGVNFGKEYEFVCSDGVFTIEASEAIAKSRFNPIEIGKKIVLTLVGNNIISYKNA